MRLAVALAALLALPGAFATHGVNHEGPAVPGYEGLCGAPPLFDGHPFLPALPWGPQCDRANFTLEVATDGYVLLVQRLAATKYDVRVLHSLDTPRITTFIGVNVEPQHTPLGRTSAPLAAPASLGSGQGTCLASDPFGTCGGFGMWFLRPQDALAVLDEQGNLTGFDLVYPDQTLAPSGDGWSVTLDIPAGSLGTVLPLAVAQMAPQAPGAQPVFARGFYNPVKLAVPLDALDAVPNPTLV